MHVNTRFLPFVRKAVPLRWKGEVGVILIVVDFIVEREVFSIMSDQGTGRTMPVLDRNFSLT